MKKSLLTLGALAAAAVAQAALPTPNVRAVPSQIDWFDGFVVVWAQNLTQPYSISIVDAEGIKVTKDETEDIEIISVSTVEYQEDEDTPNYEDSQLLVTLDGFQMSIGSTYSLYIPAGAVNVTVPEDGVYPNEEVTYSFVLKEGEKFELPAPEIEPAIGEVESIESINVFWIGSYVGFDLLKYNVVLGYDSKTGEPYIVSEPDPVTATFNGEEIEGVEVTYDWSSREEVTEGSDGNIMVINLGREFNEKGVVVVTIPADYVRVSDIDKGTYNNPEIILTYEIGTETGVNAIEATTADGRIFNLNGMEVSGNNLKGIYIRDGKKVLINK